MMATAMTIDIARIAEAHAAGFHACLDAVAREKRFLAQLEAPPLERTLAFVRDSIAKDASQFVALDGDRVVGWCDVLPAWPAARQHRGALGMGVLAAYRGQGVGQRLMAATLAHARSKGLTRVDGSARRQCARHSPLRKHGLRARRPQAQWQPPRRRVLRLIDDGFGLG
jgi:GNAT superfamily N-acetyltransferase